MREQQSRATQERHERMLNALFSVPGNDRCADCTAKNPRWASYSLGVFLCIRCASLHRKMGTHVSKVKSVSMDRWTLQEIQHMTNLGGNLVVNQQINTNPKKHPLPIALDDDHAIERYIRDKWERQLFKEEEDNTLPVVATVTTTPTTTSITRLGDSNLSLATTSTSSTLSSFDHHYPQQQQMIHTPSLSSASSSSMSSPQQLAGRVSPSATNPFMMQSYNPFSSSSTSSVVTPTNNNPFITHQPLQQSPFEFHDTTTTSYFSDKRSNSNPFLL